MEEPKFSILVSAYNAELYLEECIESVIKQTFKNYELIVVDDGSKDSTLAICKKYQKIDKRIRVYSWENHGLILARRKGIELSRGQYILFLDADDTYKENALEIINESLRDDADVVIFRFEFLYESGLRKESKVLGPQIFNCNDREALFNEFINNYEYNHMWAKVIQRKLLVNDTFDYWQLRNIKLGEDLLQSIQVYGTAKKVIVSNEIIYSYRVLKSSMSHGFNERHMYDISKVYELLYEYVTEFNWKSNICRQGLFNAYSIKISGIMRELWSSDENLENKKLFSLKLLQLNPQMLNTKAMVIQNRLLWLLVKAKAWSVCMIYIRLLKCISKIKEV